MFEDNFRKVEPYTPGEQTNDPSVIKINTNECPYPPSPEVEKALKNLDLDKLRLYPQPACNLLVDAIAEVYGLPADQVFVGVGSDDVLSMAFMTFFNSGKPVLFPDITYSFYDVWANLHGVPYKQIPLDNDFNIVKEDYYQENGGVIFPNPNAPTGVLVGLDMIEDILVHNPNRVVIVDEAYIDFGGESALPLIDKYENLLVVQTYSKSRALAGIRIGMAFGSKKLIKYLSDVKFSFNSYTMNTPALVAGAAAIRDKEYFEMTVAKVIKTREWMKEELKKLGFEFRDSMSNFVFATHPKYKAKDILDYLRANKVLVRYFNNPRIDNYLRISVGTDEQANKLIALLKDYIK